MRYLLDTHILLWAAVLDKKLPEPVAEIIKNPDFEVYYSVVCPWELVIKEAKGKIALPSNFFSDLPKLGFSCLNVNEFHIQTLRNLSSLHGDPFDRMIVAQAKAENITLITCDKGLVEYPIKLLFIDR